MPLRSPSELFHKSLNMQGTYGLEGAVLDAKSNNLGIGLNPNKTLYVDPLGGDDASHDGSIRLPYATLKYALGEAQNGYRIVLNNIELQTLAGGSAEIALQDIEIVGAGTGNRTTLSGDINLAESSARVTLQGITITGNLADASTVGQHNLKDVAIGGTLSRTDSAGYLNWNGGSGGAINISGAGTGNTIAQNLRVLGAIVLDSQNDKLDIMSIPTIGTITHSNGILNVGGVGTILRTTGNSIVSTANNGSLNLVNAGLKQADGTYGAINKTGTCGYSIAADVDRDPAADTLTGTRSNRSRAHDLATAVSATAYTAANSSIEAHIQGIHDALNLLQTSIAGNDMLVLVGGLNTSSASYPTVGRDGGTVQRGDAWRWSSATAGTIGNKAMQVNDTLIALIDGASTDADFFVIQGNVDQATSSTLGLVMLATAAQVADRTAAQAATTQALTPAILDTYLQNVLFGVPDGYSAEITLAAGGNTTITHNLNTNNVHIDMYDAATERDVKANYQVSYLTSNPNAIQVYNYGAATTVRLHISTFRAA